MRIIDYAEHRGIHYLTAWRHLKKGLLKGKKMKDGTIVLSRRMKEPKPKGHPRMWTKEKVIQAVYKLCKGRYIKASDFPPFLYKLCKKFCGSVRAAKWEAKIIFGRHWTYEKFIKCVEQFCRKRYREEKSWPPNMRELAKQFCGSIRKAKWEAGVIRDRRKRARKNYATLEGLWTKEKFLTWVGDYCRNSYKKPEGWPGYMRELAVRYCGSARKAKWEAKILKDQRKKKRTA